MYSFIANVVCFFCFMFLTTASFAQDNFDSEFDTIIKAIESAESTAESGKGTFTYEYIMVDSVDQRDAMIDIIKKSGGYGVPLCYKKSKIDYYFKGPEIRCNVYPDRDSRSPFEMWAYNGKTAESLMVHFLPDGKIERYGGISNDLKYFNGHQNSPTDEYKKSDYIKKTRSGISNTELKVKAELMKEIGEETVNGDKCKVLRIKNTTDGYEYFQIIWLNPRYNYLPVQIKDDCSPKNYDITTIDYKIYKGGIIYPEKITTNMYLYNEKTKKVGLHNNTTKKFHDNWVFDIAIPDTVFELSFPKGTKLKNEITGERNGSQIAFKTSGLRITK